MRTRVGHISQDGDAQQQETDPLLLPQLIRIHEAYHVRGHVVLNSSVFTHSSASFPLRTPVLRTETGDLDHKQTGAPVCFFLPVGLGPNVAP